MKKLLYIFGLTLLLSSCEKDESSVNTSNNSKSPIWEIDLTIDGNSYHYKSKGRDASLLNSKAYVKSYLNNGWWIDVIGEEKDFEHISGKTLPQSVFIIKDGSCGFLYNWSFSTTPLPGYFEAGPLEYSIKQKPELAEIDPDNFEITYKKPLILEIPKQTVKADFAKSSVTIEGKITAYRDIQ
ncbi:MAG: hypothetical protein ACON5K_04055 [Bacteroidia bacterium]